MPSKLQGLLKLRKKGIIIPDMDLAIAQAEMEEKQKKSKFKKRLINAKKKRTQPRNKK